MAGAVYVSELGSEPALCYNCGGRKDAMAQTERYIKIEVESANGTPTDLTQWTSSVTLSDAALFHVCPNCLRSIDKPPFLSNPIRWLFPKWHKCRPVKRDFFYRHTNVDIIVDDDK